MTTIYVGPGVTIDTNTNAVTGTTYVNGKPVVHPPPPPPPPKPLPSAANVREDRVPTTVRVSVSVTPPASKPASTAPTYTDAQVTTDVGKVWDAVPESGLVSWDGTSDSIYGVLQGKTTAQLDQLRAAYAISHGGRNMDADILKGLSGADKQRAQALLHGSDPVSGANDEAEAAHLNSLMKGQDAAAVVDLLRHASIERRQGIAAAYQRMYGKDLNTAMQEARRYVGRGGAVPLLTAGQRGEAQSLLSQQTATQFTPAQSDAAAKRIHDSLDTGMFGWGWTKEIDQDKLKDATQGLTPEQMQLVQQSYQRLYGKSLNQDIKNSSDDKNQLNLAQQYAQGTSAPTNSVTGVPAPSANPSTLALELRSKSGDGDAMRTWLESHSESDIASAVAADPTLKTSVLGSIDKGKPRWEVELLLNPPAMPQSPTDAAGIARYQDWQASYDAARMRRAVNGMNDEQLIRDVLQGKTGEQIDAMAAKYKSVYGEDIRSRLVSELDGRDQTEIVDIAFDRRHNISGATTVNAVLQEKIDRQRLLQGNESGFSSSFNSFSQRVGHWNFSDSFQTDSDRWQSNLDAAQSALNGGDTQQAANYLGFGEADYQRLVKDKGKAGEVATTTAVVATAAVVTVATGGTATPLELALYSGVSAAGAYKATNGQAGNNEVVRQGVVGAVSSVPFGGKALAEAGSFGKALVVTTKAGAESGAATGFTSSVTNGQTWDSGFVSGLQQTALNTSTGAATGAVVAPIFHVGVSGTKVVLPAVKQGAQFTRDVARYAKEGVPAAPAPPGYRPIYHATKRGNVDSIANSGQLVGGEGEYGLVFGWNARPTNKELRISGAKGSGSNEQVLLRLNAKDGVLSTWEPDPAFRVDSGATNAQQKLYHNAIRQPGPISVRDVEIVSPYSRVGDWRDRLAYGWRQARTSTATDRPNSEVTDVPASDAPPASPTGKNEFDAVDTNAGRSSIGKAPTSNHEPVTLNRLGEGSDYSVKTAGWSHPVDEAGHPLTGKALKSWAVKNGGYVDAEGHLRLANYSSRATWLQAGLYPRTGLGNSLDAALSQSPAFRAEVSSLHAQGWTIEAGVHGRGSYCLRADKKIVLDAALFEQSPEVIAGVFIHEMGHALYTGPVELAHHKLVDEVAATFNVIHVQRQLRDTGVGFEPVVPGKSQNIPLYERAYDQFMAGDSSYRDAAGLFFGTYEVTSTTGRTYGEHYLGEPPNSRFPYDDEPTIRVNRQG